MSKNMQRIVPLIFSLAAAQAQAQAKPAAQHQIAAGAFEVRLTPQPSDGTPWGRMRIAKTFTGQLQGASSGEMLAVQAAAKGSAGYVALEQVSAELEGRKGTFFLQHSGLMNKGAPTLTVSVVPDSASGELAGLTGSMDIRIENGQHFYSFTYLLPAR